MEVFLSNLKTLKSYGATGLKAEFESEYLDDSTLIFLNNLAKSSELDFTIKLSGAGSIHDLVRTFKLGATNIVSPMIETPYALEKFVNSIDLIYSTWANSFNFFINIETIESFNNFEKIINSPYFNRIKGVVFGRSDFAHSLGLKCKDTNSTEILNYAIHISSVLQNLDKMFIIGGAINPNSIDFLLKIPYLSAFETRKVIFNSSALYTNPKISILKALEFEIEWLKNKELTLPFEDERIKRLSNYLQPTL